MVINGGQHKNATVTNLRKVSGASGLGIVAAQKCRYSKTLPSLDLMRDNHLCSSCQMHFIIHKGTGFSGH